MEGKGKEALWTSWSGLAFRAGGFSFVRAEDDPSDPEKPRGKQALGEPEGIFYPRTTGIWQTVWLEWVPESHVASLRLTPDLQALGFRLEVRALGEGDAVEVALFPGVRGEASPGGKPWLEARFPLSYSFMQIPSS